MIARRLGGALVLVGALEGAGMPALAAGELVGITHTGELYSIDPDTGAGALIGSTGISRANSMAFDARTGQLWVSEYLTDELWRVDPATAEATLVTRLTGQDVRGLASGCDGLLYALVDGDDGFDEVWTIDMATFASEFVGATGYLGLQSLAFGPSGRLYSWSETLVELDPDDAGGTPIPTRGGPPGGEIQALAVDSMGRMRAGRSTLYSVHLGSGEVTPLGALPESDFRGLEFIDGAIQFGAERYCISAPNSVGPGATLFFRGSASVEEADAEFVTVGLPPGEFAWHFYGGGETQLPFGDGFLCVAPDAPQLFRLGPPLTIDAAGTAAHGIDFDAPPANAGHGRLSPGAVWRFQLYYRDQAAGAAGFNLSDAVRVRFCL